MSGKLEAEYAVKLRKSRIFVARMKILSEIDRICQKERITPSAAIASFIADAAAGRLSPKLAAAVGIANARKGGARIVSRGTLYNWLRQREASVYGLMPRDGGKGVVKGIAGAVGRENG
jgi:hypothetical protein